MDTERGWHASGRLVRGDRGWRRRHGHQPRPDRNREPPWSAPPRPGRQRRQALRGDATPVGVRYLAPDADNDGWRANVDRDDHDPQAGYCPAQPPPPLIVTSTGDSASYPGGQSQPGYTLRCALADANAAGSGKMIAFALSASDPAPRAWFARALWQALDSYFSVNHLP